MSAKDESISIVHLPLMRMGDWSTMAVPSPLELTNLPCERGMPYQAVSSSTMTSGLSASSDCQPSPFQSSGRSFQFLHFMTMSTPLAFASLKLASVRSWKGLTSLPSGIEIAILCTARLMSWMNRLIASSASSITVMLGPVYISPRTSARSPFPALATMSSARWCAMSFPNAFF